MVDYQETQLWMNSLGSDDSHHREQRELLRTSYKSFWDRTSQVVSRISRDFPNLTLHDATHLASLWERAGQLIGDEINLNPLEAYVLGGAILLHDAGHAISTFEGGLDEIESSEFYKDALINAVKGEAGTRFASNEAVKNASKNCKSKALFYAVRKLHAQRAEKLAFQKFDGEFLIENNDIRTNLGTQIGKIAASHNWNRDYIAARLSKFQGTPSFLPAQWSFNPQRVAFILRCADAIQIDQGRAPSFAFALQRPDGISRLHWTAQQLGQPQIVDKDPPSALVFTSLKDFKEVDADAWWIANDLIGVAHEELQECYLLMKDLGLPTFLVNRVLGARDSKEISKYIKTDGWQPIKAEIKISNPTRIIEMFGGSQLYGEDLFVPIRELIQNGADAIRVRKALSKDRGFKGSINISLQEAGEFYILEISDDGIGMSEFVMTNTLLEFGKSFLSSEDAQTDLPGLVGLNISLIGRYGIGFFSVFTLSNEVEVISRRYNASYSEARSMKFNNGIYGRPLVSKVGPDNLESFSTKVSLRIRHETLSSMLSVINDSNYKAVTISFAQLLTQLCSGLDCELSLSVNGADAEILHRKTWIEDDNELFLRATTLANVRNRQELDSLIVAAAPFLRVIRGDDNVVLGKACINFKKIQGGLELIGGLTSGRTGVGIISQSEQYVGVLEFESDGPSRVMCHLVDTKRIADWASEQADLLERLNSGLLKSILPRLMFAVLAEIRFRLLIY